MREGGWFVCFNVKIPSLSSSGSSSESLRMFRFDVSKQTFSGVHPEVEFFNLKINWGGKGVEASVAL